MFRTFYMHYDEIHLPKGTIIMHDLVIILDNLLKDRRDTIAIITKLEAKTLNGIAPNIWERAVYALAKRTKRMIDIDIAATFNKMSLHTDGQALKSFVTIGE